MIQTFTIGQRLDGFWPNRNERETLAEYQNQTDRRRMLCEVEKVLAVSTAEYDRLVTSFMVPCGDTYGEGGCNSDADLPDEWIYFERFMENGILRAATEDERRLFREKMYQLVTVLQAPDRDTILVNRHGYDHAQHVGFLQHHSKVLHAGRAKKPTIRTKRPTPAAEWCAWIDRATA